MTGNSRGSGGRLFRHMGFDLILIGALLFFNPNIGVADFLPDVIGWALIAVGMYRLRDMGEDLTTAYDRVKKLLIVSAARALTMILVPGMEDKGYSLVFTFIFCVFETGLMISFFKRFYSGLQSLSLREGGGDTVGRGFSDLRLTTGVFAVVRAAFNLLPELKYLSTSDYEGEITAFGTFDLANYPTALLVINLFFAGVAGLVWLFMFVPWMRRIIADRGFIESLRSRYETGIGSDAMLFGQRRARLLLITLGIGFGLYADIFLDGINYVPDFAGTLVILIGLFAAGRELTDPKRVKTAALILLPLNTAVWIYGAVMARFYTHNVFRVFDALYGLIGLTILSAAEAAVTIWLTAETVREMRIFVRDRCGELDDPRFARLAERKKAMQSGLYRVLSAFFIVACLSAASGVINYFGLYAWDVYWLINAAVHVVYVIMTVWLFSGIYDQINVRWRSLRGE